MEREKLSHRLAAYLPWVLWLGFIFSNSLRTASASSAQSAAVLSVFLPLLKDLGASLEGFHTLLRKLGHFTEFAVLGGLLTYRRAVRRPAWAGRVSTLLLAGLLAALTDETLQLFSVGRSAQVADVWIDFAGVALGIAASLLFGRWHTRQPDKV